MSVFTKVSIAELTPWLKNYGIGSPIDLQGIAAGIENTNYFVTTTHGRFVLTLFERLTDAELHFYLELMAHLARHGVPCPSPIANRDDKLLGHLNGKPATLVTYLPGKPVSEPTPGHCRQIGATLAEMHVAGQSFKGDIENPRGHAWRRAAAQLVIPFLDASRRELLNSELSFQDEQATAALPRGPIHGDMFRDNVLWQDGVESARLGGVIDFYFAGRDSLLFDVAVTVNDWCVAKDGVLDLSLAAALLDAYRDIRAFTTEELATWPAMLRAAALRFWLSRLYDFYLPRAGELTHAHDPEHFRRILEARRSVAHDLSLHVRS